MSNEVNPQDPAICEYTGLANVRTYVEDKEKRYCYIHDTTYNEDGVCSKCIEENNK